MYSFLTGFILNILFMMHLTEHSFGIHRHKRYSKENVCNVSLITMELVEECPRNNKTLQIRLKSKRCSDFPLCKSEPLVYHCVPYEGSLVEVCAPEGHIIGNICPLFDGGLGRVIEDFNTPCKECPFHYRSNMSFMYPECEKYTSKVKETVVASNLIGLNREDASTKLCLTKSKRIKRRNICNNTTNLRFLDTTEPANNVTELTSSNKEDIQWRVPVFISISAPVTVALLLVLSIIVYCCINRRKLKYEREDIHLASKEESEALHI
ncbi:uncharacterized protein LOC111101301 [Crassostrea virginica]|uniref:Uncharacterized protein LOC111101301 n=1 Tax=Crassostrea virginica TaxID=6565 RepID=A0A8B8AG13_CRAVI|nr:uncharacterized protein LOC111101301 [Crassostrea virginica]XP_022289454.1 uncharacterized protein LOC111101301 [Crassostrea virginica]XP_022289455.1 uncharacterized protein LOC111101301 [Crassostrea virginica]